MFLYTSNEKYEKQVKKIPFIIASKNNKILYLGTNVTKEIRDVHRKLQNTEKINYKDISKRKEPLCSWTGSLNIVNMAILPKTIYRFSAVAIKNPMVFLVDTEKLIYKIIWDYKEQIS